MEKKSFDISLTEKFKHQTDKEAEYYRDIVIAQGDYIELLKSNVKELQGQLQTSYRRINELREIVEIETNGDISKIDNSQYTEVRKVGWTIYTRPDCSFCELAKIIMTEQGIEFQENNLSEDKDRRWFKGQGFETVPQIFDAADNHVGGYEELKKLLSN